MRQGSPARRLSPSDLDQLLATLEVSFLKLSECLIATGWRLVIGEVELPGMHYVLAGHGRMVFENGEIASVGPHTMVIVPPKQRVRVDAPGETGISHTAQTKALLQKFPDPTVMPYQFVAGSGEPTLVLICGYFQARHGRTIDLFAKLASPIVEQFDAEDRLDDTLKTAMSELVDQRFGTGVMTAALMKQVFVTLFRRALVSTSDWVERFSIIGDAQISRAFADMVARPGASHSVQSLAQTAGLSRSVFMERFSALFGRSPMSVLRELRMRQAALLLATDDYHVDQIAHTVGYANRSSFCRAFRKAHGSHPSDFMAKARERGA